MCTAIAYQTKNHYFGRNLDLEYSYQETVTVTPRKYSFAFREMPDMPAHYAMIGMAYVVEQYPLYYDATNEKGLSMAGLNFSGNAVYKPIISEKDNIAPFELIPWILGQCESVSEAKVLLQDINIADISFSEQLPVSPLHWMIADKNEAIVLESVEEGVLVYDNPAGVLTNNPPFPLQLFQLQYYMGLSEKPPKNTFSEKLPLSCYSHGMGTIGLPGDLTSTSRFVRATFVKEHSLAGDSESESISQFFHILGSVAQRRGCVEVRKGEYEITVYSSCCNTDKGIYYYTTYENSQITGVDMFAENLDGDSPVSYPLVAGQQIFWQNGE